MGRHTTPELYVRLPPDATPRTAWALPLVLPQPLGAMRKCGAGYAVALLRRRARPYGMGVGHIFDIS